MIMNFDVRYIENIVVSFLEKNARKCVFVGILYFCGKQNIKQSIKQEKSTLFDIKTFYQVYSILLAIIITNHDYNEFIGLITMLIKSHK